MLTHSIHIHDLLTWIGGPLVEVRALTATRVNDPAAGPWSFDFKKPAVAEAAAPVLDAVAPTKPLFTGQFQRFADALAEGGSFPITLADAQATLELVTAWYRSARTGSVETLPLSADHPDRDS